MNIQKLWPTPVMIEKSPFDPVFLGHLKELVVWRDKKHREAPIQHSMPIIEHREFRPSYNLFNEDIPEQFKGFLSIFRAFVKTCYLSYLKESYNVSGIDDAKIVARCFGNVQVQGQRTKPHYHHTCDHVFVLYLDCGENRKEVFNLKNRQGDGELLMLDPRLFSSFPFWEKTQMIPTHPGLMLLHPASIWHETNPMTAEGSRAAIIVTLKFASHNYTDLYCDF